jgi:hypothetical protein
VASPLGQRRSAEHPQDDAGARDEPSGRRRRADEHRGRDRREQGEAHESGREVDPHPEVAESLERSQHGRPALDLGAERTEVGGERAMSRRPITTNSASIAAVANVRGIGCTTYMRVLALHREIDLRMLMPRQANAAQEVPGHGQPAWGRRSRAGHTRWRSG